MRYLVSIILVSLIYLPSAFAQTSAPQLDVTIECPANPRCAFNGSDLPIAIKVTNISKEPVELAAEFVRRRTPQKRLTDKETNIIQSFRARRPQLNLLNSFESIPPGDSVTFNDLISAERIRSFGRPKINLKLEVVIITRLRVAGAEPFRFVGEAYLDIIQED